MKFETLLVTIIFIIPGFIITGIKHIFNVREKNNSFSRTIESLIFSLFIYTIISLIGNIKNQIAPFFIITINQQKYNFLKFENLFLIWAIILFSAFLGWGFGKISKSNLWELIHYKLFNRNHYRNVWHEIHERNFNHGNGFVEVKFKGNDKVYIGYVDRASDYDDNKELYLTDVYFNTNNNERQELDAEGMLVKYDNVDYIIFSPGSKSDSEQ